MMAMKLETKWDVNGVHSIDFYEVNSAGEMRIQGINNAGVKVFIEISETEMRQLRRYISAQLYKISKQKTQ